MYDRGIESRISHVTLNGDPNSRYPGNLNFSFAYVEGESLLMVSFGWPSISFSVFVDFQVINLPGFWSVMDSGHYHSLVPCPFSITISLSWTSHHHTCFKFKPTMSKHHKLGFKEYCGVIWICVHIRIVGTQLCSPCNWFRRRVSTFIHSFWNRPIHNNRRDWLRHRFVGQTCQPIKKYVTAVGDGARRDRFEVHSMDSRCSHMNWYKICLIPSS